MHTTLHASQRVVLAAVRLVAICGVLMALPARGATITWLGTANGDWTNPANWQGGSVPSSFDVVKFSAASNRTLQLMSDRIVAGMIFGAEDAYLIEDTGDSMTVSGAASFSGGGTVTFDNELILAASGVTFSGSGASGMVTVNGEINGSGGLIFSGGNYTLTNNRNGYTGGTTIRDGAIVTLAPPAGVNLDIGSARNSDSLLGRGTSAIAIDGGTLRLVASGSGFIGTGATERLFAFGTNGGLVDFVGKVNPSSREVWSFQTSAAAVSIPVVRYGTPASATDGWAINGSALQVGDGNANSVNGLIGPGAIVFDLGAGGQGALLELRNTDQFTGTLTIRGVPGGSSSAPNGAFNVARVSLRNDRAYSFNWQFEHAVQMGNTAGNSATRTLDGNLTLAAGADVAFAGRPDNSPGILVIGGANAANQTLTVNSGAQANIDVGFRTDATRPSGVSLNMKTVIEPGGTLRFRKTVASLVPETAMQLNASVTGKGTSAADARFDVAIDVGTADGQLNMAAAAGFVVNGSGTGGLRIEGSGARLAALLTPARIRDRVSGSGGAFTIAPDGVMTVAAAPLAANNPVKLGIGASGAGASVTLGSATNDMANWAGLVVKPSSGSGSTTVTLGASQALTSGTGVTTALDILGGILDIGSRNLSVEGRATLATGGIAGASGVLTAGDYEVRSGEIAARLAGSGPLIKTTAGMVALGGVNTYLGATVVEEGTLQILAGGTAGAGDVDVAAGATLALDGVVSGSVDASGLVLGSGTIVGALSLSSGATLEPGEGVGQLSAGGLAAPADTSVGFDIAGSGAAVTSDQLRITGGVTLGATLQLNILPGYFPAFGDVFALIDNDGGDPIAGIFAGLPQDAQVSSGTALFAVSYTGDALSRTFSGAGNDFMLMSIPEPRIAAQLIFGTAALMVFQRKRRRFRL